MEGKRHHYYGSLHNHTDMSNFRLRDSINTVEKLIDRAIELNHSVVAITEHETIASAVRAEKYYNKIKQNNPDFKVILGNEIYLCRNGLNASNFNREQDKYYHFILLAKDDIGHKQIREISTRAWMRAYSARGMMRVPTYYQDLYDVIGKNPGHVIASTACLGGALPTQLLKYRDSLNDSLYEKIIIWCERMKELFGEDFYLEMQPSFNKDQIYVNKKIIELSELLNIKFIITNDSHYLRKEDRPIHKAFLNAKDGDREVDEFYMTTYLMDNEEIYSYMEESLGVDNLQKAFENILEIKNKCSDYTLYKPLKIPRLQWKQTKPILYLNEWLEKIPYITDFLNSEFEEDKHLVKIVMNVLEENLFGDNTLHNKLTYDEINACLEDIWISSEANKARWSAYLLNLQNIIDACWDAGTLVGAGRGSGVGFLLLYILGITQINPLREKTKTYRFRFLNPKRVSPLDIDVDIEGNKRQIVLDTFRKLYGSDRVAGVLTLRTEKSKSAILTAARGLGIDVDIAQYLASMIESDRGELRTLKQTFYGDEENGFKPNQQFVFEMTNNYPELWTVAQGIEGLCCGTGVHAGGVIFVDEPFIETTALMRSPKGEIITQLELHDSEYVSNIKYDILSIESLDKIHNCLSLLAEYGFEDKDLSLREIYEKTIGIYNIERDNLEMWKMVWNHQIMSLFQMEKQSGIQGIATLKPTSVDELAILNSTIRLMAQEKGGEMPTDKLARFKKDIFAWDAELARYCLGEEEKEILKPILDISYGLCITQEQFMQLVQLPELGGFPLEFADRLRKSIAKKNPAEYEKITEEFFQVTKEKGCNQNLCTYVWNVLIAMSRGYGFNASHTLAYSLIGLQEMNLAFKYPIIFWNCACLISDSGGTEKEDEDDSQLEDIDNEYCVSEDYTSEDVFYEEEEDDDEEEEEENLEKKKKKKAKKSNFGKIATAIGKMLMAGITVSPPDINKSSYTFSPDVENNIIRYGLSGIVKVGEDLIKSTISNRPYSSLQDYLSKVKATKPQVVNLIKSGAFDCFGDRQQLMKEYIELVSDKKKTINLRNMKMLIDFNLIPQKYDMQKKVYNFNKYLKKFKNDIYYSLDNIAYNFYSNNFNIDDLILEETAESGFKIKQVVWDKKYQNHMDIIRPYVKNNKDELLEAVNGRLFSDMWNKYCLGSISKWEMDSVSYYSHEHELSEVEDIYYDCCDFFKLPEEPIVDRVVNIKGKTVPLFKIHRIMGTVLDKDKNKKTLTLLTKTGVVTVKIYGAVFTNYDKQISEKNPITNKKKVIEKSFFTRGNKVIITGIRRGDNFIAKKYSRTPYHLVELITNIENGMLTTKSERAGEEEL